MLRGIRLIEPSIIEVRSFFLNRAPPSLVLQTTRVPLGTSVSIEVVTIPSDSQMFATSLWGR